MIVEATDLENCSVVILLKLHANTPGYKIRRGVCQENY
jgi:hypothetical protein